MARAARAVLPGSAVSSIFGYVATNLRRTNGWLVGLATLWVLAVAVGAGIPACVGDPPVITSQDGSTEGGACAAPLTTCGSTCVETSVDPSNCGKCGTVCGSGLVCSNGSCTTACATGTSACPLSGGTGCVDEQSDNQNCGGCGTACPAGEVCSAGKCGAGCAQGLTVCTAAGATLCANTTNDDHNCGTCGNACGPGFTCVSSACVEGCATGLLLCAGFNGYDAGVTEAGPDASGAEDGSVDGGAAADAAPPPLTCIDPNRDDRNCGACGATCAADQSCASGTCTYAASCLDLLNRKGPLADGTYTIFPFLAAQITDAGTAEAGAHDAGDASAGPHPFPVYCLGMGTPTPTEYLTFAHSALTGEMSSNFSMAGAGGGCYTSTCVVGTPLGDAGTDTYGDDYVQFTRVRLLVPSLVIDPSDRTFAFPRDPTVAACWAALSGSCPALAQLVYGEADDCICSNPNVRGMANIDLRDTGFSLDPSVNYESNGSSEFGDFTSVSPDWTVINLTGGGCCGGYQAVGPMLLDQN